MEPGTEPHAVPLDAPLGPDPSAGATFAEFVLAQTTPLLRLALVLTGNPHDAWDLVQEALARTGERWGRHIDQPAAYTRTVMVHLNIDRIRRLRRERPVFAPQDDARSATERVHPGETGLGGELLAALATLPPRQRTALALRYVEDLDIAAIAVRMRCSEGTVKSQLSRGTARLKAHLAPVRSQAAGGPAAQEGKHPS